MPARESNQALTCENCGREGHVVLRTFGPAAFAQRASQGFSIIRTNKTWVRCACGADVWFAPD